MNRKSYTLVGAGIGLAVFLALALLPSLLYGGYAGVLLAGGIFGTPVTATSAVRALIRASSASPWTRDGLAEDRARLQRPAGAVHLVVSGPPHPRASGVGTSRSRSCPTFGSSPAIRFAVWAVYRSAPFRPTAGSCGSSAALGSAHSRMETKPAIAHLAARRISARELVAP